MAVVVRKRYAKKATGKKVASRAAVVKLIKKELTSVAEHKVFDVYSNTFPIGGDVIDFNGTMYNLSNMGPGLAGQQNRTGDIIEFQSLKVKMMVYASLVTPAQYMLRCVIFRWHPHNAGSINVTQILENLNPFVGTQYGPVAALNHMNRSLYTVHYDKLMIPHNDSLGTCSMDVTIPLRGKRSQFSTGVTDGQDQLFMCLISDSSVGPETAFFSRLTFTDV